MSTTRSKGMQRIRPIRVVDDGVHTYIQMSPAVLHREAPVLAIIGPDGKAEMVNYRVQGSVYVVDRLFERGRLILGSGRKAQKADITRGPVRILRFFAHDPFRGFENNQKAGGKTAMTRDIDSPTGLDMHPRPPTAVRVSKRVGFAALIVCGAVAFAIVYGIYERQQRQLEATSKAEIERKATPATGAGHEVTSKIPAGDVPVLKPDVASLEDQTRGGRGRRRPVALRKTSRRVQAPRIRSRCGVGTWDPISECEMERAEDREEISLIKESKRPFWRRLESVAWRTTAGNPSLSYSAAVPTPNASIPQIV